MAKNKKQSKYVKELINSFYGNDSFLGNNDKQKLHFTILILIIFSVSLMFFMIGKDSGYNESQNQYEEINKKDITQYDLYVTRQAIINSAILILSAGIAIGIVFHGFAIITVNK